MKSKTSFLFLLLLVVSLGFNFQQAYSQNLDNLSDYSIKLAISPSHVENGDKSHPIGYVYITNKNGVSITSSTPVDVHLDSDNPSIASVPDKITIPANAEYGKFDIRSGIISGETTISAKLNDKVDFEKIRVGVDQSYIPNDAILYLNLPTKEMHINSVMPFTVFFKTSDGYVIRAPSDIEIKLEYEDSMASINQNVITIKKGNYYAWGLIETHKKIGNTFIRAINEDTNLDTAKSISISSTLPDSLQLSVFPKLIPAEYGREVDIFVSVLDSEGNPTKAHHDILLEFFSNSQYPVGESLDDTMRAKTPVIKKGEFGYHLKQKLHLQNTLKNNIMIGVSSEGYGTAIDTFRTVGKSIELGDTEKRSVNQKQDFGLEVKDYKNAVQIFGPTKIPSNSTAVFTYQISLVEQDEDDDGIASDGSEIEIHPDCAERSEDTASETEKKIKRNMDLDIEERILYTIDCLDNEGLYPLQSNEHKYSDGYVKRINVISSDDSVASVMDAGNIQKSTSFGSAKISSGQKSGSVIISTSVNGIGTASFQTEVINTLEQKEIRIFSPVGNDLILFDKNGNFDLFLISIDGSNRPKVMEQNSKYLVTPTNGLLEINKDSTFAFGTLRSDSFSVEKGKTIDLTVVPIGEEANNNLESTVSFATQPSSMIKLMLPNNNLNVSHSQHVGIVQIVDMQGNPIPASTNLQTKIFSDNDKIVQVINDAIIHEGTSYATFPLTTTGSLGNTILSASAKGVVGSNIEIDTSSSLTQLKIFTSGLPDEIPANEEVEIQLFIDDENAQSVENASVKIKTDDNSTISPDEIRTGPGGDAKFSIIANGGPTISLDIIATAEGYSDGQQNLIINVDSPEESLTVMDVALPEWVVYIVIAAILLIVAVVVVFLKKSHAPSEEDWEEEEI